MSGPQEPVIESLPVVKLTVDHEVQRTIDKPRVDRMIADYQPNALGVVVVNHRADGTYHIIDGQHRVQATIGAGFEERSINCLVYNGLERSDEAAMFRRLNNTRQVTPLDRFRVRVIEGDPVAVALNDTLNRHGWTVSGYRGNAMFAAVAALEGVYKGKMSGEGSTLTVCDTMIKVITEAWGHDANAVRAEIVSGLGAVLLHYSRVDLVKLTSEMAQFKGGPLGLLGKAKGLHEYRGGRLSDAFAEVLVELVNKQRRANNRIPDWRST